MNEEEKEKIYNKHFVKLYRFFYYKSLSKEIAEDLTSDTFLKFLDIVKSKEVINNAENYLYGIAKNVFLKFLKDKYNLKTYPINNINDLKDVVDEFLEEIDEIKTPEEIALKYINKLPEKQKLILKLRLIEKYSIKEIAVKLEKNINYVKTTQKRAIRNLKLLLANLSVP